MGPRSIGRGNMGGGGRGHLRRCASMGPRPIGRGNPNSPVGAGAVGGGFNGAATDRSRKWTPLSPTGRATRSFNGAATDRSRKCLRSRAAPTAGRLLQWGRDRSVAEIRGDGTLTHDRAPASMGPRPIGRGNMADAWTAHGQCVLQWGRDRSVAEIPRPGDRGVSPWWRFNGAATDRSRKLPQGSGVYEHTGSASMGPRPIGRGNYHHLLVRGQGVKASMGPRPIGRGNVTDTVQYLTGPGPLQWGRDRSVAEIHKVYGHAGEEEACFNGAATDRSRKSPHSTSAGAPRACFNGAATDGSRK